LRDEVLIEVIYHLMVAKDAKVYKKEAIRSDLSGLCVRGFFTPWSAKDAKVENKDGIRGGLSGLRVIRFSRYKKRPEGDCPSGLKTNQDFATSF